MYKDVVIKKRVWVEDDHLNAWDVFDADEQIEYELAIANFNGRIPVEDGVRVGEWITNGFQLIKSEYGELLSEGSDRIRDVKTESIEEMINSFVPSPGVVVPIGIYSDRQSTAVQFSNGQYQVAINLKYFQYIYDSDFDYELNENVLILKQDGLVCGAVSGMNWKGINPIWERPYSLADVEALTHIQGEPTLP